MAKNKFSLLLAVWLLPTAMLFAGTNRYVVFFKDKAGTPYQIDRPLAFLTQKAVDRRGGEITEEDLPVSPAYLQGLRDAGAQVFFQSRWLNGAMVQMDDMLVGPVGALPFVDSVVYVAPGTRFNGKGRVGQPDLAKEGRLGQPSDRQREMLGAEEMNRAGFRGEGITIAVFDGGFVGVDNTAPFDHLFADGRLALAYNFVDNTPNVYLYSDHGTSVLSAMGAYEPAGYQGIAHESAFMLFLTEDVDTEYRVEEYNFLFAAEMADSAGADVLHASLGYNTFDDPSMDYTVADLDGKTAVITQAANFAAARGMLVVNSAGNSGSSPWRFVTPPADSEHVLSIGAVDRFESLAPFSSVGPTADGRIKPDLVALGVATTVVRFDGGVSGRDGTSFAAPLVAGLAAGIWQAYPEYDNFEIMDLLRQTASGANDPDNDTGFGIPNYRAVKRRASPSGEEGDWRIVPNPIVTDVLVLRMGAVGQNQGAMLTVVNALGQTVANRALLPTWPGGDYQLPVGNLAPGAYSLRVDSGGMVRQLRFLMP